MWYTATKTMGGRKLHRKGGNETSNTGFFLLLSKHAIGFGITLIRQLQSSKNYVLNIRQQQEFYILQMFIVFVLIFI